MPKPNGRRFSREVKLAAVKRMLAGEDVPSLAKELGTTRKSLYEWRAKYQRDGAAAFRGPRQLRVVMEIDPPPEVGAAAPPAHSDLAKARARVSELERKIGQQQLELDFFQNALRQVRERRRPNDGPGVTTSTRQSRQ